MNYQSSFYGELTTSDGILSHPFEMLDILVRGKWIKADSFAASKLFTNLQLLNAAKEFAFYTTSEAQGRVHKILRDFHARESQFNKLFRLRIAAFFSEVDDRGNLQRVLYSATVHSSNCQLVRSFLNGIFQSYWLTFTDAVVTQEAAQAPAPKGGSRLNSPWRTGLFPIGHFW
jgi:hypothetical protein